MDKFIETKNNLSYSNYYQFLSKEFQSEKFNNFKYYLKNIEDVTPTNRGYYIKSNIQPEKLKSFIKNINWNKFGNSSANGGVSWFSKPEFIKIYDENKPI